jgi:hypothetical protein
MSSKLALYALAVSMLAVVLFSIVPTTSFAAADPDATKTTSNQIKLDNPLGANATIPSILKRIFNQLAWILTFCIPIIIIVGAFQMMFSAGNPEKFATGQKTITYAIIGYVIILMANGLVSIVTKILTP